jgi:hypothetical protein
VMAPVLRPLLPEKLGKPTKRLYPCQAKSVRGRFIPLPATKTPANSGARPEKKCAGQPAKRLGRTVISSVPAGFRGRTRGTREVHAHERRNQHISARRKNFTLPHVYAKASKILGPDGKPAGMGLFTTEPLPEGAVVTEYGMLFTDPSPLWNACVASVTSENFCKCTSLCHFS